MEKKINELLRKANLCRMAGSRTTGEMQSTWYLKARWLEYQARITREQCLL